MVIIDHFTELIKDGKSKWNDDSRKKNNYLNGGGGSNGGGGKGSGNGSKSIYNNDITILDETDCNEDSYDSYEVGDYYNNDYDEDEIYSGGNDDFDRLYHSTDSTIVKNYHDNVSFWDWYYTSLLYHVSTINLDSFVQSHDETYSLPLIPSTSPPAKPPNTTQIRNTTHRSRSYRDLRILPLTVEQYDQFMNTNEHIMSMEDDDSEEVQTNNQLQLQVTEEIAIFFDNQKYPSIYDYLLKEKDELDIKDEVRKIVELLLTISYIPRGDRRYRLLPSTSTSTSSGSSSSKQQQLSVKNGKIKNKKPNILVNGYETGEAGRGGGGRGGGGVGIGNRIVKCDNLMITDDLSDHEKMEELHHFQNTLILMTNYYSKIIRNIITIIYTSPSMIALATEKGRKQDRQNSSCFTNKNNNINVSSYVPIHKTDQIYENASTFLSSKKLCASLLLQLFTEDRYLCDTKGNHIYIWNKDPWLHELRDNMKLDVVIIDAQNSNHNNQLLIKQSKIRLSISTNKSTSDNILSSIVNAKDVPLYKKKDLTSYSNIIRKSLSYYDSDALWLKGMIFK